MLNNHNNYGAIYRLYNSNYRFNFFYLFFSRTNDEIVFNQPKKFPFPLVNTETLLVPTNIHIYCAYYAHLPSLQAHSPLHNAHCTHKIILTFNKLIVCEIVRCCLVFGSVFGVRCCYIN